MFEKPPEPSPVRSEGFGKRLRSERERRGITLDSVAQATKISASIFAEMERDDFSKWPPGIFGRSFIRGYAEIVGLNPDEVVAEYLRLHPDGQPPPPRASAAGGAAQIPVSPVDRSWLFQTGGGGIGPNGRPYLRLTLDESLGGDRTVWRVSTLRQRMLAAVLDLVGLFAIAAGVAQVAGAVMAGVVAGGAAVFYYLCGSVVVGSPLSLWWLTRHGTPRPVGPSPHSPVRPADGASDSAPA